MPRSALNPHRETTAQARRPWLAQQDDPYTMLQGRFQKWMATAAEFEELFKKHVYENPDFDQGDARQHRQFLSYLMWTGEDLAGDFEALEKADAANFVNLIDQKLDEYRKTLHAWHGPIESQSDLPESFKQGIGDYQRGKVVDMHVALNETPEGV